jgi:Na+/H+ antiporter NhaD/arsenite permease-like protein
MHLPGKKNLTIRKDSILSFNFNLILFGTGWAGDTQVSWFSAIPFACVLLLIAVGPMFFHHFWESDKNKSIAIFLLSLPVVIYLWYIRKSTNSQSLYAFQHSLVDYLCFMSLIGSLYVVSSGIVLKFKWKSTPLLNAALLACGAILANFLGTTGASILLFKPYIYANRNRNHKVHLVLFFIFIVGNMGGLLTPLGDPPLFLGFLNGIDFFWTISLWPQWLVANTYLLITFLLIDFYYWRKDHAVFTSHQNTDDEVFHFFGKRNFIFLGLLLFLVLLQSPSIGKPLGAFVGKILPVKNLTLPIVPAAIAQLFVAALAFATTPNLIRRTNEFSWLPIREVAILFVGIFITMIPALEILRQHSSKLALDHAWQYFWVTGGLSSILDNAPTFLAFTTLAAGDEGIASLSFSKPGILAAICCGAVFMGANTYIGNGPNFLIKAMAEKNQIKMPSFFTYAFLAFILFLPLYLILSFLFFW